MPTPGSPMSGGEPGGREDFGPEDRESGRVWSKVLWLAILVVAGGIFALQVSLKSAMVENPTPPPQDVASMELRYASRVNFGYERLTDLLPMPEDSAQATDLSEMLANSATGPIELVRASIVAAAAKGDKALALRLLDRARVELEELERDLSPLADDEAAQQRAEWFDDMRRDIELVGRSISLMDGASLTSDERDRLTARHGDFGEMVRVIGAPDSSPTRQRFEERGLRTLVSVIVMVGVAGLAIVVGFVLFVIAFVMLLTRRVRPRLNIQSGWTHAKRTLLLEAFLLFLVSFIVISIAAGLIEAGTGADLQPVLIWLMLLTPFWPLLRGMSWSELHLALGWHANGAGLKGVMREAGLGVVGYLAGLPIVLGFIVISLALVFFTQSQPSHPATTEAMNADLWTAIKLYILASLWAPIVEETAFRGLLYYNIRRWATPILSALVVAFVFAIIHPQGVALVPALMGLAVVFALLREWRGSIIGPMVAHAMHNAFVISLVIFVLGK